MRIAYLVPGSGDLSYCENCLRDGVLIEALMQAGQDVLAVPLYLPPMLETDELEGLQVFFGGVNVFLQQKWGFFRRAPEWLNRLCNRPSLLRLAAGRSGMTDPAMLAETAQSMLLGSAGHQARELEKVGDWLAQASPRIDVVILSNALLAGMAAHLREKLAAPVVCLLQDEHEFLDLVPASHAQALMATLRTALSAVSQVVSVSRFYDDNLATRLGFQPSQRSVVYPGIRVEQFPLRPTLPKIPALGFLSRWSEDKGPHRLAQAYQLLREEPEHQELRLHFAGGWMLGDEPYIRSWRAALASAEQTGQVTFTRRFDQETRRDLFDRLHLLVVAESRPPAFRRYVLEALCTGVTVIAPPLGVFKELAEVLSEGLVLCDSEPAKLAQCCAALLRDPAALAERGRRAHMAVQKHFSAAASGLQLAALLEKLINEGQEER